MAFGFILTLLLGGLALRFGLFGDAEMQAFMVIMLLALIQFFGLVAVKLFNQNKEKDDDDGWYEGWEDDWDE